MRTDDVLVVMAKYPVPGSVKTRLAAAVGAQAACELYRAFLVDAAARFAGGPWRLIWAVTPAGADLGAVLGAPCAQIGQRGETLGERMWACFAELFAAGARRVVMIGADAPHLAPAAIGEAFAALAAHDAVFVPTRDGGYCAVGLRMPHDVFTGVPMGGSNVFARTREVLAERGLRWRALSPSFDVDEPADVDDLAELIEAGTVDLPHTARVLRHWQQRVGALAGPRCARP